jgi:hypothetical protein
MKSLIKSDSFSAHSRGDSMGLTPGATPAAHSRGDSSAAHSRGDSSAAHTRGDF